MVSEKYDVIIIGAGPGGVMASLYSKGKTLLVEKKKKIGEPVRCAEFVYGKIIDYFDLWNYIEDANEILNFVFNFPNKKQKRMKFCTYKGYIVNKDKMLQRMVKGAVANNDVDLRTNTTAAYEDGHIILNDKEIVDAKVIIAADGFNSGIGRTIGLSSILTGDDVYVCAQYKLKGDFNSDTMQIFFGDIAPGGYAWCFPKSDTLANVGLGIPASRHLNVKHQLDQFVASYYPNTEKEDFFIAPISLALPVENCVKDNVILVGEAARYIFSPTGGGNGLALLSGKIAGEVATEYLEDTCGIIAYQYAMTLHIKKKLIKSYKFKQRYMQEDGVNYMYKKIRAVTYAHRIMPATTEKILMKNYRF